MNMSVLTLQEYEFEKQFNEHAAIQWMQENWELGRAEPRRDPPCWSLRRDPRGCPGCDEMEPHGHTRTDTRKRTYARTQPCPPNGNAVPVACFVPRTAPAAALVPGAVHAATRASAGNVEVAPRLPLPSPASYPAAVLGPGSPTPSHVPSTLLLALAVCTGLVFTPCLCSLVLCCCIVPSHPDLVSSLTLSAAPWCLPPACPVLSHCPHVLPQQCHLPSQVPSIPESPK
ncbi:elongation of very long chain fatty acids protein 6 isoform X2 [Pezoporus flaviventris]|uniref:elongation of very long chain fatty acids protein 6 isoform X2 n=1 Tax=Pezoporus flaviventris TaxID=889875 RepID=UPI002AB034C9|nr:elongation of very long chain fatty acids protein 6 isoform X2 [Pezoporus flaviventris]